MNKVKPFYIKLEPWMANVQVAEVFDKAVQCGARLVDEVEGVHENGWCPPHSWRLFGVGKDGGAVCWDKISYFGEGAVEITLDQVDEHLGLNKPTVPKQLLRGTKLDLRKPDGSVDKELSAAFQEACFEQGIGWCDGDQQIYLTRGFSFLYVESNGLSYGSCGEVFKNDENKQIQFSYNRKLEWSIKDMTEQRKVITLGGVEYYEDDVMGALALLETAKVVDDGVSTQGGGTPPDRPNNAQ